MSDQRGDAQLFDRNWKSRQEKHYNHWTRGAPRNQIQLAFRNHWDVFRELLKSPKHNRGKRCLEVGCGRGSISAYFSDAGYDCVLLDKSAEAIEIAQNAFSANGLKARFVIGDALSLPFAEASFDVVVSIGLLEHFQDIEPPLREQVRVMAQGGLFLGYVVPQHESIIQRHYGWVNEILKGYVSAEPANPKEVLFRTGTGSRQYTKVMKELGFRSTFSSGIYPLPMISHSIEFPFSLMPEASELALVCHLERLLGQREKRRGRNPWLCAERYGQAFLVWGYK